MSNWHIVEQDDIDIEHRNMEVNIWVYTDNRYGNCYVTLTFEQIKNIYDEIIGPKT